MALNGNGHGKRSLVVIQLSGGNDALNTVVPYSDGHYYDFRPSVSIAPDNVLRLNDDVGLNPNMGPMKRLWDEGNLAIVQGAGYPNPNRSHFRSMDIWHTAESEKIGDTGWLGACIRELDPEARNVLTGVNFGRGLPRALSAEGVSVASVGNLETYGLFPDIQDEWLKKYALDAFTKMYGSMEGKDTVAEFLGSTGMDVLKGADILRTAPQKYSSSVEYAANPIAQSLKSVAQVMFADLGTRVYYAAHGSFDTHAGELDFHAKLWEDLAGAVGDFTDDLKEHGRYDDTLILMFSEFGRRIEDNGSGTDHGSGGHAFVLGGGVDGGLYGEYPSLKGQDHLEGDLHFSNDFRSTYDTIVDQWLGLDSADVLPRRYDQFEFIES